MMQCTNLYYGAQIPKYTVNDLLNKTEEIIRIKQICKEEMSNFCNTSTKFMVTQNLQNLIQKTQQKPKIENETPCAINLQADNFTPLRIKHKALTGKISLDSDTIRKWSAGKSTREQYTACTSNRKREKDFSQTFSGPFFEQRTWTQSQCRKRNCRTAKTQRRKEIKLKQQLVNESYEDEKRRMGLFQRRRKQEIQKQKAHEAFLKMSYHKRLMKEQFDNAKIVEQKPSSLKRNKQMIEIVNFEIDDGVLLTNRVRAPLKSTIENIINLRYEESKHDRIQRRNSQDQRQVENSKIKKNQKQKQQQIHKNTLINQTYNNKGNRQLSFIPYVNINPGVSLSESAINATIVRSRPSGQTSRQKFLSTIQNKTFRSYSKDYSQKTTPILSQMRTIDVCQNNKASKSSLNNETKDSFRKSILWSAKNKSDWQKVKIEKIQLLKELTDY